MRNWTIKTKLTLLSVFLLGALATVGAVNFLYTKKLVDSLSDVSQVQLPAVRNMTLADMMHDGLRAVA